VFENRELRRIYGPKRDEETEGWRKPHNEDLHDLESSSNIIRMMNSFDEDSICRACSRNVEDEGVYHTSNKAGWKEYTRKTRTWF
jgi:hypothetical protein